MAEEENAGPVYRETTQDLSNYVKKSKVEMNLLPEVENIEASVKQTFRNRLFLGRYAERRYVEHLQDYRDVIVVSNDENDLIKDLELARKKLRRVFGQTVWIGMTSPKSSGTPAGYCFWVQMAGIPFGCCWFQIKQVKFSTREVCMQLKHIRSVEPSDLQNSLEGRSSISSNLNGSEETSERPKVTTRIESYSLEDLKSALQVAMFTVMQWIRCNVTWTNLVTLLRVTCALLVVSVVGVAEFVKYLGDFIIQFMREFNNFVHVSTPFMLGVLDFFSKIIGGILMLIAMIWRSYTHPRASDVRYPPNPTQPCTFGVSYPPIPQGYGSRSLALPPSSGPAKKTAWSRN